MNAQRTTKASSLTSTSQDIALPPVSQDSSSRCNLTFTSPFSLLSVDRLITAKDHASIQIRIADVDADGKAIKGQATTVAICGRIRAQGDSDDSINRIATKEGRESSAVLQYLSIQAD